MAQGICPYCETEYRAGARFCDRCGAPVGAANPRGSSLRPNTLPEFSIHSDNRKSRPRDIGEPRPGLGEQEANASGSPKAPVAVDPRTRPGSLPEAGARDAGPVGVGWRPAASAAASAPAAVSDKRSARGSRPVRGPSGGVIVGHVRGLREKPENNFTVYSFRVESFDELGNRLTPVTVEMRGISFEGSLNEGDEIEIQKKYRPGRTIKVSRLHNITAASPFKAREYPFFIRILTYPLTAIGWLLTVAFIIGFIYLLVSCARVWME